MEWKIIVLWTLTIELIICVYSFYRNEWAYKHSIYLLNNDPTKFDKLVPYDDLAVGPRFWCWDIEKFIK